MKNSEIKKLQKEINDLNNKFNEVKKSNTCTDDFPKIKRSHTYRENVSPMAVSYV